MPVWVDPPGIPNDTYVPPTHANSPSTEFLNGWGDGDDGWVGTGILQMSLFMALCMSSLINHVRPSIQGIITAVATALVGASTVVSTPRAKTGFLVFITVLTVIAWIQPASQMPTTTGQHAYWIQDSRPAFTMPITEPRPERTSQVQGYVAFADDGAQGSRLVVAPDSMSAITIIHPRAVSASWKKLPDKERKIQGIGADTVNERVLVGH